MSAFRGESLYDRKKAILEPSFVCEALGIQGRVDLMTTDCKLLVEQKSGRNMNIETHQVDPGYHSYQLEYTMYSCCSTMAYCSTTSS